MVDVARSIRLCRAIDAAPKECFNNALKGQFQEPCLLYTEGYILFELSGGDRIPLTHGWLETEEGQVVDPTFPLWRDEEPPVYVSVARYGRLEVADLLKKDHCFYPWTMRERPDFWRAETMRIMEMAIRCKASAAI